MEKIAEGSLSKRLSERIEEMLNTDIDKQIRESKMYDIPVIPDWMRYQHMRTNLEEILDALLLDCSYCVNSPIENCEMLGEDSKCYLCQRGFVCSGIQRR